MYLGFFVQHVLFDELLLVWSEVEIVHFLLEQTPAFLAFFLFGLESGILVLDVLLDERVRAARVDALRAVAD